MSDVDIDGFTYHGKRDLKELLEESKKGDREFQKKLLAQNQQLIELNNKLVAAFLTAAEEMKNMREEMAAMRKEFNPPVAALKRWGH